MELAIRHLEIRIQIIQFSHTAFFLPPGFPSSSSSSATFCFEETMKHSNMHIRVIRQKKNKHWGLRQGRSIKDLRFVADLWHQARRFHKNEKTDFPHRAFESDVRRITYMDHIAGLQLLSIVKNSKNKNTSFRSQH